jgi:sarcosine oxidase subunit alpha
MKTTEVLVIGGGPAGLSAALEAATHGAQVTLVDSDLQLGGQLIKQTHKFFGSEDEHAGTRGYKIGDLLFEELESLKDRIDVRVNTTALGYYKEDGMMSFSTGEEEYFRLKPERIVMATGAMERLIPFPKNDLPGVYGAGAIQTLMNVYGVTPGKRVLMIGAGNIGLIVSYQLMQAGVDVAGVVEFMPRIGGYWVHAAKIRRLGVPVLLRHTIVEALGETEVTGAVIQAVGDKGLEGDPIQIDCDIICLAVGLTPTAELLWQAGCDMQFVPELCGYVPRRDGHMRTSQSHIWVAGDAAGIEEASSAMVEGRLAGLGAARSLGQVKDSDYDARLAAYWERLTHLRAGEVGEKIRCGLGKCSCECWGD